VVIRPYEQEPLNQTFQSFPPKQMRPVYRSPLSLGNQSSSASIPAQRCFPNPGPLNDGFENGGVFGVQCAPW